jgi:hypothetical protein
LLRCNWSLSTTRTSLHYLRSYWKKRECVKQVFLPLLFLTYLRSVRIHPLWKFWYQKIVLRYFGSK